MTKLISIHDIRSSLKKGESKVILEQDLNDEWVAGVINETTSQFITLTNNELIELTFLMKKKERNKYSS